MAVYQTHPFNQEGTGCRLESAQAETRAAPRTGRKETEAATQSIFVIDFDRLPAFASTSMNPNASKRRQWGPNGENHCGIMTLNSLNQNKELRCFLPAL